MRTNTVQLSVLVTQDSTGLNFSQQSSSTSVVVPSSVIIEELSEHARLDTNNEPAMLTNTDDASMDTEQVAHTSAPPVISEAIASRAITGPRSRRARAAAPISTSEVRRSLRSNKYDGLKVPPLSDIRKNISKVKPRVIPSVGTSSSASSAAGGIPPPTPIATLQDIGVNRCAITAAALSDKVLLAEPAAVSASSESDNAMDDLGEDISRHSA